MYAYHVAHLVGATLCDESNSRKPPERYLWEMGEGQLKFICREEYVPSHEHLRSFSSKWCILVHSG